MDNRRQPNNPSIKPYDRSKSISNPAGKSYGSNSQQPKDRNFQNNDNRSYNSDHRSQTGERRNDQRFDPNNRDNRFQNRGDRDNRFQGRNDRDNRYPSRNDGDNRFQNRDGDNRFQNRDGGGQRPGSGRTVGGSDNRFQGRDNRFAKPGTGGKFTPRGANANNKFPGKKPFFPKGKTVKPWEEEDRPRIVSDMQVTDGKHRGTFLVSTASPKFRLTSRRLREVMFRILFRKIRAKRFLDLCAGSGTVGIEAMSRGALLGTFVERSAKMCSFIKKNMAACGIKEGHGEVFEAEVVPFLKEMKKRKRCWDVVYFNPPYDADYDEALKYLARGTALNLNATLVIEHHAEMFFPEKIGQLHRWRVVVQGDSALSFFERK